MVRVRTSTTNPGKRVKVAEPEHVSTSLSPGQGSRDPWLEPVQEVYGTGVLVIDYSKGKHCIVYVTGDITSLKVINWPVAGRIARLTLEFVNQGAFDVLAWDGAIIWPDDLIPGLTKVAGGRDRVVLSTTDGGTIIYGDTVGFDYGDLDPDNPYAGPFREILTANRTYYVRTDGDDANDGLTNNAGGAFATIQKAVDVVAAIDLSVYHVTIQVGAGSYTINDCVLPEVVGAATVDWGSDAATMRNRVNIFGDIATPSNVSLTGHFVMDGGGYYIAGFTMIPMGLGYNIYYQNKNVTNFIDQIRMVQNASYSHTAGFDVYAGVVYVACWGTLEIVGGSNSYDYILYSAGSAYITVYGYITFTSTPVINTAFLWTDLGGIIEFGISGFTGTFTGKRFKADGSSYISTYNSGLTYIPGTIAGTATNGGLYDGVATGETHTVSGLPSAVNLGAGARSFVTDANATTFASVVVGGGSNKVPVYSDGTSWRIG